jgi:hypothetical protein
MFFSNNELICIREPNLDFQYILYQNMKRIIHDMISKIQIVYINISFSMHAHTMYYRTSKCDSEQAM